MKDYVRLTIEELALRRAALEHQMDDIRRAEELLRTMEDDPGVLAAPLTSVEQADAITQKLRVEMSGPIQPPAEILSPALMTEQDIPSPERRRGPLKMKTAIQSSGRPGSQKGSRHIIKPGKFKGVVPVISHLPGGPTKYRANYWDGQAKKNQSLGTFTDMLEAAMAVAKRLSDKSEIQRISDLIKQRDNNSAKPPKKTKPPAGPKKDRQSKLTHYKGVKLGKPLADGTPRYEVIVCIDGQVKYLGIFSIEEEAAAVAAEARGEKAEAKRLRKMVKQKAADETEQRENNPARPATRREAKTEADPSDEDRTDKTPQVWECKNCFKQYIQAEQPSKCLECNHTEFRPIV